MNSGIYRIVSQETDEVYYGGTKNFDGRFAVHRYSLKKKKHGNKRLQELYDEYGLENLVFEILEYCAECDLENREKLYLDSDDKKINIWIYPKSPKGIKKQGIDKTRGRKIPGRSHSHTEETKKRLSDITKKQWAENPPCWAGNIKCSEEKRKKVSDGLKRYYENHPEAKEKISQRMRKER